MKTSQTHVLIIVWALAAHSLLSLIALVVCALLHVDPTIIALVGSQASTGALCALLAKTERSAQEKDADAVPVTVQQSPGETLKVEDVNEK